MTPKQRLAVGLEQLDCSLSEQTQEHLLRYLAELLKWNKAYNLTAVRDADGMVIRHLLDSISVLSLVTDERCLDLGTGAGLPGMVLAIINPDQRWTLLDSNGKKTRFLTHARIALGLNNVTVVNARVEKWQNGELFDGVISRAFTELTRFAELASPFCAPEGRVLAMVGKHPQVAVGDVIANCSVGGVTPLCAPFDEGERHFVQLHPIS
ncbi:MAG: 16S rRNA (guanine(527)-N(7))-methyltransferase RsmG [Granulosicoccaceae bacterium]